MTTAPSSPGPDEGRTTGRHRSARSWAARPRALAVAVAVLALLVALGVGLLPDRSGDGAAAAGSTAGAGAEGAQALRSSLLARLPAIADTPDEQLRVAAAAVDEHLSAAPTAVGPAGEEALAALRRVEQLDGPARRLAAVVAAGTVAEAVTADRLDAEVGRQLGDVLHAVAAPDRLIDLVQTVEQDPAAVGPAGPQVHAQLVDLDHAVPSARVPEAAAALLQSLTAGVADGQLSRSFHEVASPVLLDLADPGTHQALLDLLADAERDPARVGPAAGVVLAELRALAVEPVWPQGNRALELLALVRDGGRVTPAFRDEAVPVLEALVR